MKFYRNIIWKILCVIAIFYIFIAGLLSEVPELAILEETIRNLYFHVPMWWTMMLLFLISMINSISYLRTGNLKVDFHAVEFVNTGLAFGVAGLLTGMVWAKFTWGAYWSSDAIQNGSAATMLLYFAYLVLRGSFEDVERRARVSAVFNVLAFFAMIPLIWVIPRVVDSLHPGKGGNPGFSTYDLDNRMRLIFYPAAIAWFLLGLWIASLKYRIRLLKDKKLTDEIK